MFSKIEPDSGHETRKTFNCSGGYVDFSTYSNEEFDRGAPIVIELIWLLLQAAFVSSWIPGSKHRRFLLRMFGGKIGRGVILKPGVRVKFPWRLEIGDWSWIGEGAWIDNLSSVKIGKSCCISQGSYLCTGSHDWSAEKFDLITGPIEVRDCAWIAAHARIGPGTIVSEGAVLAMGAVASGTLLPWTIYSAHPLQVRGVRTIQTAERAKPKVRG